MGSRIHPDHVIGAAIADLGAGRAGIDAVLDVRIWCLVVVMHEGSFAGVESIQSFQRKRQTTELSRGREALKKQSP